MPSQTLAHISPAVLRWARESMGLSFEEAAQAIGGGMRWSTLQMVEEGVEYLTIPQAERVADAFERPLATLFLPEPPREEPQEALFRRLPGAPNLPWPPEMRALARRVRARQEAVAELYDLLDEGSSWDDVSSELRRVPKQRLAATIRTHLGISLDEQFEWLDPDGYVPLRAWVDAVEALGVLVMQDGSMPVDTLRGFAALDRLVPVVVANTKDDPRARAFTVLHELGHHVLQARGEPAGSETEPWCNQFAGEVIMPRDALTDVYTNSTEPDLEKRVNDVALRFGVTPLGAAVRLARSGLLEQSLADQLIARMRAKQPRERAPGGSPYLNKIAWLGPTYIRLVFAAADAQALTLSNAAGLLGVKVNHFGRLRERVEERTSRS